MVYIGESISLQKHSLKNKVKWNILPPRTTITFTHFYQIPQDKRQIQTEVQSTRDTYFTGTHSHGSLIRDGWNHKSIYSSYTICPTITFSSKRILTNSYLVPCPRMVLLQVLLAFYTHFFSYFSALCQFCKIYSPSPLCPKSMADLTQGSWTNLFTIP